MSTTTTNFGLVKPALTDSPPDITVTNGNWDKVDEALGNNARYETAGGTGTVITLSAISFTNSNVKSFIVAANNNSAATTVNGKSLYKRGTTTAPKLLVGRVVAIWYSTATGCFYTDANSYSDNGHTHTKSEITDFPTSLPANGGNADTIDGYHVSTGSSDISNRIPKIYSDGVMEVGSILDFHRGSDGSDYAVRLEINSADSNDNNIYINGNKLWNSGNDGFGSGLSADDLRGSIPATDSTPWSIAQRDASGNLKANIIESFTPNNGTTGGFRARANATSGKAIIQFTDNAVTNQFGWLSAATDGLLQWNGNPIIADEAVSAINTNTIWKTGFYRGTFTNYPPGLPDGQGNLIAFCYNSGPDNAGWTRQMFISAHTRDVYVRHAANNEWDGWYRLHVAGDNLPTTLFTRENGANEGGQIYLQKSALSTLSGDIAIDNLGNSVRIFEMGGAYRGVSIDLLGCTGSSYILHSGISNGVSIQSNAPNADMLWVW